MSDTSNFSPIFTTCHPSSIHEAHCRYLSCCGHFLWFFFAARHFIVVNYWLHVSTFLDYFGDMQIAPKKPMPPCWFKVAFIYFLPTTLATSTDCSDDSWRDTFFGKHEHGTVTSDMWRHRKTLTYLQTVPSSEVQYGMRSYFNVHSKADISQLNLLHGTKKTKSEKRKKN